MKEDKLQTSLANAFVVNLLLAGTLEEELVAELNETSANSLSKGVVVEAARIFESAEMPELSKILTKYAEDNQKKFLPDASRVFETLRINNK